MFQRIRWRLSPDKHSQHTFQPVVHSEHALCLHVVTGGFETGGVVCAIADVVLVGMEDREGGGGWVGVVGSEWVPVRAPIGMKNGRVRVVVRVREFELLKTTVPCW